MSFASRRADHTVLCLCFRWARESLEVVQGFKESLQKVSVPWLSVHGDADSLCDVSGSKCLHEVSSSTDKTFSVSAIFRQHG